MAPLPGFPGGGRFPSALLLPPLLMFSSLSRVQASATLRSGDPKDSYPAGTVLRYRCIPGYEPIPGETLSLTCLDTSKWSVENPRFCQGRRCTAVTIENGRIVIPSPMQIGDEITLGCNEGYRLIGEKTLRCVLVGDKAEWHTDPPICRQIRCYPPDNIEFGSHSGQPHEEFHYGSTVTYTCNEGFSLIGSPNSTCSPSSTSTAGVWLPRPPKCKVVRCREPEIENGRVTTPTQDIYTYGDRASFECNPGYVMVGRSTCTCGPNHGWIPRFPKCVWDGGPPQTTSSTNGSIATTAGEGGGGDGAADGGGDVADAGGEDVVDPGQGGDPQTTLPPDEIESNNTPIIVGCILAFLIVLSLIAVFWKYRSSMKTGEPQAPTIPAEFNEAELEPKGSQLE